MPTLAQKPATTPIPVQLSATEFQQFILPHLSMPKRGPKCKLGYHRVFNLILWLLYTGMQWKCLPVPKDCDGKAEIHYTTVYKVFARWSDDGSLEEAFIASVAHLSEHNQLDLSVLHGYGETGDMWVPLAVDLARDHTVIVPDLRGLGRSSKPPSGFDKRTQAGDVAGVLAALRIERIDLVTHDIGNMVGFAFAAQHPAHVRRFVLIDAPLPGVGPWDEILKHPLLWHFRFGGPDMERLVAGRERIYLDRFWNEFSADPRRFSDAAREHYAALYALPGAMHAGFAQFAAFDQDVIDNQALLVKGKLTMPVLAVGGEQSFGTMMATVMRFAASDVQEAIVPDAGHWIMEENPHATIQIVRGFLDA